MSPQLIARYLVIARLIQERVVLGLLVQIVEYAGDLVRGKIQCLQDVAKWDWFGRTWGMIVLPFGKLKPLIILNIYLTE